MAAVIFDGMKDYSFMHSSMVNTEAILEGIKSSLPILGPYLDARLKTVVHTFDEKT